MTNHRCHGWYGFSQILYYSFISLCAHLPYLRHLCAIQIPTPMQIYRIRPKPPHPAPLNFVRKFKLSSAAPPTAPIPRNGIKHPDKKGLFPLRDMFDTCSFQVRSKFVPPLPPWKRTKNEHGTNMRRTCQEVRTDQFVKYYANLPF